MYIKTEPKGWNMFAVFLYFKKQNADQEDAEIKKYLKEHNLLPKTRTKSAIEDDEYEVWYFGGCYLRNHFQAIAAMQRRIVSQEMLVEEISEILKNLPDIQVRQKVNLLGEVDLDAVVAQLADKFHIDSSFGSDDDGNLKVTLSPEDLQASFLKLNDTVGTQGVSHGP